MLTWDGEWDPQSQVTAYQPIGGRFASTREIHPRGEEEASQWKLGGTGTEATLEASLLQAMHWAKPSLGMKLAAARGR